MWRAQLAVKAFTAAMNRFAGKCGASSRQAVGATPMVRDGELRARLVDEESAEMSAALRRGDLVEAMDGAADLIVVVLGACVACGVDIAPIFEEVMRTNRAKLASGASFREDGKLVKPPDWEPPRIREILAKQGWAEE